MCVKCKIDASSFGFPLTPLIPNAVAVASIYCIKQAACFYNIAEGNLVENFRVTNASHG